MSEASWVPDKVDVTRPSAARIYDYMLGGGHNFASDRAVADHLVETVPGVRKMTFLNRAFLRRAVLFMMEQGIRQFLDLGSGIPTVGNVHEIAHDIDPTSRVVYVDYEDVAVAHSELILKDVDNATVLQADATEPEKVLASEQAKLLDFSKPIGLLAVTFFHYVSPERKPYEVMAKYRDAIPSGSFTGVSHFTPDLSPSAGSGITTTMNKMSDNVFPRPKAEVERLFEGYELVEPGLVAISRWRPESAMDSSDDPSQDGQYAAVARKS